MNNCRVMWGDKELDVVVHNLAVEAEHDYVRGMDGGEYSFPSTQTLTLTGRINMHDGICREDSLAGKIARADMKEDDKLLRKHGVVDSGGVITGRGIEVLSQIILADESFRQKLVTSLKAIDKEDE